MNVDKNLIKKVEDFIFDLFKSANINYLLFHNYKHTYEVVNMCKKIGKNTGVSSEELEIILLAAWFHDVGYLTVGKDKHEEESVRVATEFLNRNNYASQKIKEVNNCIMATKIGSTPKTILEEIICDADLSGLGSSAYFEKSALLKLEFTYLKIVECSEEEWLKNEILFLENHKYHTKYAHLNYGEIKSKNLIDRKSELNRVLKKNKERQAKKNKKSQELHSKKIKDEIPEKGIETMFRTALKNHMALSAIADNKANIMLSINAIVLSIIVSSLFPKLDGHPELILPSIIILIVCLSTIVLATLSTKPKITGGMFSTNDVKSRKTNLLFFGNFHKMDLSDYEWGMKEMMKDKEYLYSSLIRDLHSLGVVLAKKYKFLRLCYLVFMYGIILSVIIFAIVLFLTS